MISPADLVGLPTKVVRSTALFLKKKTFFVRLLCRPAGWHMDSCVKIEHISIRTSVIDTRNF